MSTPCRSQTIFIPAKLALTVLFLGLYFLLPYSALAATLSLSPENGSYSVGTIFSVSVNVQSAGKDINAVSGALSFPNDLLEVMSLSKGSSIITSWVQEPAFSNTTGIIQFEGVVQSPGFSGSNGKIITMLFRVKKPGAPTVSFTAGSVLANDGEGTELITGTTPAQFNALPAVSTEPPLPSLQTENPTVVPQPNQSSSGKTGAPPNITSDTHPLGQWSKLTTGNFSFVVPKEASELRFVVDQVPSTIPTGAAIAVLTRHELKNLKEGISYLHLQYKTVAGWSEPAHYILRIDTTSPLPFEVKKPLSDVLLFSTSDTLSGMDRFEVSIDGDEPTVLFGKTTQTFPVPVLSPGNHTIIVTAYDTAGNSTKSRTSLITVSDAKQLASSTETIFLNISKDSLPMIITASLGFLVLLVSALLIFVWKKLIKIRRVLEREAHEVKKIVHRAFSLLQSDIEEDIAMLERASTERTLTREEIKILERLQKNLDEAEQSINHEITDIEELLR